ncbi:penicillin-binding protein activator [Erythrobacteraceae bacterium E2-1 Yellow Sea]|nr:penicillin-binding protein activator [Erythrobacteraceae bacterium E2-1 Yellow Sea]
MKRILFNRRSLVLAGSAALLAGCQVIPKTGPGTAPTDGPGTQEPSDTVLPTDETRHRIALLVPMSGTNGEVGKSIANATTMALLDTNADNLRITTYDTAQGARNAAERAMADGNLLILGPLLAENVPAILAEAQPRGVPLITFSNDTKVAGPNVFIMGQVPEQSIARTVGYARAHGSNRFAALLPQGDYGDRAEMALVNALRDYGGALAKTERYSRGNTAIVSAAGKLKEAGGYDTVLIADSAKLATQGAGELRSGGTNTKIMGTELWSGENSISRVSALRGALFSSVSNQRFTRFSSSYETRFGTKPYRLATLGYDSVLLTLRVARDWRVGRKFPTGKLLDDGGFLGLDGAFRFGRNGVIERAMEVRQIGNGTVETVDAAPARFGG